MKKNLSLLVSVMLIFGFVGCACDCDKSVSEQTAEIEEPEGSMEQAKSEDANQAALDPLYQQQAANGSPCSNHAGNGGYLGIELKAGNPKLRVDPAAPDTLLVEWGADPNNRYSCYCEMKRDNNSGGVWLKVNRPIDPTAPIRLFIDDWRASVNGADSVEVEVNPQEGVVGFVNNYDNYYLIGVQDARDNAWKGVGKSVSLLEGSNLNLTYEINNSGNRVYKVVTHDAVTANHHVTDLSFGPFESDNQGKEYIKRLFD